MYSLSVTGGTVGIYLLAGLYWDCSLKPLTQFVILLPVSSGPMPSASGISPAAGTFSSLSELWLLGSIISILLSLDINQPLLSLLPRLTSRWFNGLLKSVCQRLHNITESDTWMSLARGVQLASLSREWLQHLSSDWRGACAGFSHTVRSCRWTRCWRTAMTVTTEAHSRLRRERRFLARISEYGAFCIKCCAFLTRKFVPYHYVVVTGVRSIC